ncbi:MAG: hypothetical protein KDI08_10220, partial [Pseudomonadales bacterium]|nr:hypothetical protein [Pseudomonadales bacterium]
VFTDGSVTKSDGSRLRIGSTWIDTFDQLKTKEKTLPGWQKSLPANGSDPSTRVLHAGARIADIVLFSDHQPSLAASCDIGSSHLHVLHHQTGTALIYAPIGSTTTVLNNSKPMSLSSLDLGPGIASMPVIHQGAGDDGITVITQQSTGSLTGSDVNLQPALRARQSWLELDPAEVFK